MIEPGAPVVVHLGSPREQVFGAVLSLSEAGLVVRGVALSSVDDWLRSFPRSSAGEAHGIVLTTSFYPMHRVEKVALDEPSFGAPAIHERFERRAGMTLAELLASEGVVVAHARRP